MWVLLALACARPAHLAPEAVTRVELSPEGYRSELVMNGSLQDRLPAPDGSDLVILYGGEEKGSLETCGCPERPRGSVPRQVSYRRALEAQGVPVLMVNGGYWLEDAMSLDGNPRADVPVLNHWMVAGLQHLAPDALNLGYNDMAGITSLGGPEAFAAEGLPVVSANVAGPGVVPWRIVERGGLRVGITGITTPGVTFLPTPGFQVSHPRTAKAALTELRPQVDLVVLLVYAAPEEAKALAKAGLVDVVIDTNLNRARYAPFPVGEAVWVRSHYQTMRLGELRLDLEDGRIVGVTDRQIDLDEGIPDDEGAASIMKAARQEISVAQEELFGGR